jgi:hypothetical protein
MMTPALINTRSGRSFLVDDNGVYWRMFHFIESGIVFDTVLDRKHAYEVGRCVGRFQSLVSGLSPDSLHDTIPGFHYTPKYLAAYDDAVDADVGAGSQVSAPRLHSFSEKTPCAKVDRSHRVERAPRSALCTTIPR